MQEMFNMLIQNITNMGKNLTKVNFFDDFINLEFIDGKEKFIVTVLKEKENTENA